jgi:hypothetical protein
LKRHESLWLAASGLKSGEVLLGFPQFMSPRESIQNNFISLSVFDGRQSVVNPFPGSPGFDQANGQAG